MIPKEYYGRLFTKEQLPVDYLSEAVKLESMIKVDKKLRCKRCYSRIEEDWQLPNGQYYCRACIVFGRNQEGKELYYFPSEKSEVDFPVLKWSGKLTPYQNEVSEKLLKTYKNQKHSLVHAVTGAGKTEIIYNIVAYVLENKNRVVIASPRVDVCRELFLRMQKDFTCSISLLHADSEPYDGSPLVIATTHQLLKFYHSFDCQGQIQVSLPANAYVLNLHQFRIGDRATFFYSTNAPMPLIYPPRYQAVAAAYTPHGTTAALDVFNEMLTNSDGTLTLTPTWNTPVTLPNGQSYANDPGGHLLLATYSATTRSIPAQAIPEQVVVFCPGT